MATNDEWKKENTTVVRVRFVNSSGIPAALEKAIELKKTTMPQYVRQAIVEKLERDGFPPVPQKSE